MEQHNKLSRKWRQRWGLLKICRQKLSLAVRRTRLCFYRNRSSSKQRIKSWLKELMNCIKRIKTLAKGYKNVKANFDRLIFKSSWRRRKRKKRSKLSRNISRRKFLRWRPRNQELLIKLWLMSMKNTKPNGTMRDSSCRIKLHFSKSRTKKTRLCMKLWCKLLIKEVVWQEKMNSKLFRSTKIWARQ